MVIYHLSWDLQGQKCKAVLRELEGGVGWASGQRILGAGVFGETRSMTRRPSVPLVRPQWKGEGQRISRENPQRTHAPMGTKPRRPS